MTDTQVEVPLSPCVRQCRLTEDKSQCLVCKRTRDEIVAWRDMTNTQRAIVMEALHSRQIIPQGHMK